MDAPTETNREGSYPRIGAPILGYEPLRRQPSTATGLGPEWAEFAEAWGVDRRAATIEPLAGGLINRTFLVRTGGDRLVVRSYRRTSRPDDIEFELSAVEFLSAAGFPTPAPVRSLGGNLFEFAMGYPVAVFAHVDGVHPASRPGGFGSFDLEVGCRISAAAARMHRLTWDLELPGRREQYGDPLRRVREFLIAVQDWPRDGVPGLAAFVDGLDAMSTALGLAQQSPDVRRLPLGLVHGDIDERNVLVDRAGALVALLDFDDCLWSYRLYDLCSMIAAWGLDSHRHLDLERATRLIAAYSAVRPVAPIERELLPAWLMCYLGAAGGEYLSGLHSGDAFRAGVADSFSATTFLALHADTRWQDPVKAACRVQGG